ncbi:hypothetical protein [Streptomyces nigra]|uniref:hypothetical protein n=1 Tax=Streptomyces nigra TaxID=1827580 RepID=UPI0036789A1E
MKLISLRAKIAAGAFAITAAALLATATPAQAATYKVSDNCDVAWINCSYGDLWLFYNSKEIAIQDGYYKSAFTLFYGNVDDHWGTSQYEGSTLTTYR